MKNLKIILLILIIILLIFVVKFFVFNSNRMDEINTKEVTAKYLITGFHEKSDTKYNVTGYYMGFLISNYSGIDIDSSFEMSVDVKYKDEIIIKDAKYIDMVTKESHILNNNEKIILIKTTKDIYDKFKNISPFSKNLYTRINYFKYKKDIKWRKDWLVGGKK